jgi:DUF1680 family protein
MSVRMIIAHPNVRQDMGYSALQRGPLIYCMEEIDNKILLHRIILSKKNKYSSVLKADLLSDNITTIEGKAKFVDDKGWNEMLYASISKEKFKSIKITAIPYYAWDNRKSGQMRVWFRYEFISTRF